MSYHYHPVQCANCHNEVLQISCDLDNCGFSVSWRCDDDSRPQYAKKDCCPHCQRHFYYVAGNEWQVLHGGGCDTPVEDVVKLREKECSNCPVHRLRQLHDWLRDAKLSAQWSIGRWWRKIRYSNWENPYVK